MVISIQNIREAQKRTERAKAVDERDLLRERLKQAEKQVQRLESALQRVMAGAI